MRKRQCCHQLWVRTVAVVNEIKCGSNQFLLQLTAMGGISTQLLISVQLCLGLWMMEFVVLFVVVQPLTPEILASVSQPARMPSLWGSHTQVCKQLE